MPKTKVVHVMREPYDVYIGRGRGSPWGNPYTYKKGSVWANAQVDTPEEAVDKYREYIKTKPELLKRIPELKGKVLGCWCKTPENPNAPCHGDVLLELIEELEDD